MLDNYDVTLYKEEKARQLLDNINCPNNDLKMAVNICISIHCVASKQLLHIYQQLYRNLSQQTIHNQGGMDGDGRST